MFIVSMLRTVNFDNELGITSGKIREIGSNWQLPDKFAAAKSAIPQLFPYPFLGIVFDLSKCTRSFGF